RCKCDELAPLEHKPHFPASEFHITIYDGHRPEFAKRLLKVLEGFDWRFRVMLPPNSKLTDIPVKPRGAKRVNTTRVYRPELQRIFAEATSRTMTWETISNASDDQKLKLTTAICQHLFEVTTKLRKHQKRKRERGERGGTRDSPAKRASKKATARSRTRLSKNYEEETHLTPPELAREIADYAVSLLDGDSKINFGDPAVGTGTFFSALLRVVPRERITSAIGIDISPRQVAATQWKWAHKGLRALVGDYLHMERLPRRNLILANPPYLRHQEIRPKYKENLRNRVADKYRIPLSARSGLYVYFLLLSHEWMKPDAIAAWLIPSEFMQTEYGAAIRHYLTHKVELVRIHQFGHDDPQFENAMVLPCVVLFRNRAPHGDDLAVLSDGGTLKSPTRNKLVPIEELRGQTKWTINSGRSKYASSEFKIADIFSVRRGIATGANDFFVLERTKAVALGIPQRVLRPLLPKARTLPSDIVEREPDGYPQLNIHLCLLDCDMSEEQIEKRHPRLFAYLLTAKNLGILGRYLVRNRHPWYKQEQREPAPFLCTYMGRSHGNRPPIRFIWNKSDAVATNTYLMLYPRAPLAALLREEPMLHKDVFVLLQQTARETMSEQWRVHAEGLYKIEPGELLEVRLPIAQGWLKKLIEESTAKPAELSSAGIDTQHERQMPLVAATRRDL
ncbi:MAG: Eco57I restriction-modification methylase domain-containing protein, partial [Pyrinomonadaceae bacterium]